MHIPDEAVDVALDLWYAGLPNQHLRELFREDMRAALSGALPIILGEPVARVHQSIPESGPFIQWVAESTSIFEYQGAPLYALKEPQP